ncbi:MAG: F0F1 ATP synthase subunit gamma [Methylobacter sp.]
MSLSRELQLHIGQLTEIRSILNSMKNLAFMEIHKLQRFNAMQSRVVANIELAARDFLAFHPGLVESEDRSEHLCLLLGAERGFCGDFNESLINAVSAGPYTGIVAIGSRLCGKLDDLSSKVLARLEGANVAEEVPSVINRLIDAINALHDNGNHLNPQMQSIRMTAVYHDDASNQIQQRQLLPPFADSNPQTIRRTNPPMLNLEPSQFYADLVDHYLFAVLHRIFYSSLLAENHRREQHLEGAVSHLDDETAKLQRKSQIYRQEEITEEIEVILLNAENL